MRTMDSFEYNSNPSHVVFGSGNITKLPLEVQRLGVSRPVIVSGPRQAEIAEKLEKILGGQVAGVFSEAAMHTPKSVTEKALAYAKKQETDSVISVGGGSSVGLGKAISVYMGLPHICIPTTYAGSEMTPILGETAEGRKITRSDQKILPSTVIYDVDLTMGLPVELSATSGINAIAHSVEALYGQNTNPVISLLALEGIKSLSLALPAVVAEPKSQSARTQALYGAWLCSTCLGTVGMALHHKLCHTLGGSFNLPHAETHTIVLPHALAYNAPAVPEAMRKLATVLPDSGGDAITGLNGLLARLKVKRALRDYGMKEADIDKAAEIATANPYWNPRPLEKELLREVIRRAWAGEDARPDL